MILPGVPFSPQIEGPEDIPDDLRIRSEGGCFFVSLPFAESTDGRFITVLEVGLRSEWLSSPVPEHNGRRLEVFELAFQWTLADGGLSPLESTFEREIARPWLPVGCGPLALEAVGVCFRQLLQAFLPNFAYWRTFEPNPLPQALRKHDFITRLLEDVGYSLIEAGTDDDDRRFWLMGAPGIDVPGAV